MKLFRYLMLTVAITAIGCWITWYVTANHITRKISNAEVTQFRKWQQMGNKDQHNCLQWPNEKSNFLRWQQVSQSEKSSFRRWQRLTNRNKNAVEAWSNLSQSNKASFAKWLTLAPEKRQQLSSKDMTWMKIAVKSKDATVAAGEATRYFISRGAVIAPIKMANVLVCTGEDRWNGNMMKPLYLVNISIKYQGQPVASACDISTKEEGAGTKIAKIAFKSIVQNHDKEIASIK